MSLFNNDSGTLAPPIYVGNDRYLSSSTDASLYPVAPSSGNNSPTSTPIAYPKTYSYSPAQDFSRMEPFADPVMPGVSPLYYALRAMGTPKGLTFMPHVDMSRGTATRLRAEQDRNEAMQMSSPEDQKIGFRTSDLLAGAFPALLAMMFGGKKGGGLAANYLTGYLGGKEQGLKDANEGRQQEFQESQKQALAAADSKDREGQLLNEDEQTRFSQSLTERQFEDMEASRNPLNKPGGYSDTTNPTSAVSEQKAISDLDMHAIADDISQANQVIINIQNSRGAPLGSPKHDQERLLKGITALQKMRANYVWLLQTSGGQASQELSGRIAVIDNQILGLGSVLRFIGQVSPPSVTPYNVKPPYAPATPYKPRPPFKLRPTYYAAGSDSSGTERS